MDGDFMSVIYGIDFNDYFCFTKIQNLIKTIKPFRYSPKGYFVCLISCEDVLTI